VRVLLTGGTGYLGRAVARALAARGHELVVFSRTAAPGALPGRAIRGDIRDRAAVAAASDGCDAIVHMAALVSIWRRRPQDFDDVNVGGLANVVDAARAAGVARILCTSSFLALPPTGGTAPIEANDYQRTKVAADRLADRLVADGAPIVRVYPGVVYGPGAMTEGNLLGRLIRDHLQGKLPGVVGPDRRWSCAFVDDVAAGHVAALERAAPGDRYVLGGENASQRRVFDAVRDATGRRPPRTIPYSAAVAIATLEELRVRVAGGTPLATRGAIEIFRHDWSLDSGAAIRDLDYRVTPLAEGVRRTIASLTDPAAA
jgi:farnesol dehydrogenase